MTSPRILLKAWDIRPKKHLGQNFLLSQTLAESIVDCAALQENDHVLEIGCGLGAITIPAAKKVARLIAVEKDQQMLDLLRSELAAQRLSNVQMVHQDILTLNFMDYFGPATPPAVVIRRQKTAGRPLIESALGRPPGVESMTTGESQSSMFDPVTATGT